MRGVMMAWPLGLFRWQCWELPNDAFRPSPNFSEASKSLFNSVA